MRTIRSLFFGLLAALAFMLQMTEAQAVPSFARQTGMDCTTCHMSWLELTNVGRRFKLGGYQLMKAMAPDAERPLVTARFDENPPLIPIAGMLQFSNTRTAQATYATDTAGSTAVLDKNNTIVLQQASIFLNGKLADHVGCFCQWTYDDTIRHSGIDNAEIRIADDYSGDSFKALYGISINNNPTMSDIYNTTPTWGWPYAGSTLAPAPNAGQWIASLGQQVVGLSAYALVNQTFYLELGGYRTADKAFSIFRAGVAPADRTPLDGVAPYYRFALQQDWDKGHQSGEIGLFGLSGKTSDAFDVPTGNKFRDTGVDAQYQYITDAHRFSAMTSYIREHQDWNDGTTTNTTNTVTQFNTKVSYYYNKWYGVSLGYLRTSGTSDDALYNTNQPLTGSVNASPNTTARVLEFNWLFSPTGGEETFRKNRIVVQYTDYSKFNGGSTNYDGFGRNAKDNNSLYLLWWSLY
jgi:hypothetical protein